MKQNKMKPQQSPSKHSLYEFLHIDKSKPSNRNSTLPPSGILSCELYTHSTNEIEKQIMNGNGNNNNNMGQVKLLTDFINSSNSITNNPTQIPTNESTFIPTVTATKEITLTDHRENPLLIATIEVAFITPNIASITPKNKPTQIPTDEHIFTPNSIDKSSYEKVTFSHFISYPVSIVFVLICSTVYMTLLRLKNKLDSTPLTCCPDAVNISIENEVNDSGYAISLIKINRNGIGYFHQIFDVSILYVEHYHTTLSRFTCTSKKQCIPNDFCMVSIILCTKKGIIHWTNYINVMDKYINAMSRNAVLRYLYFVRRTHSEDQDRIGIQSSYIILSVFVYIKLCVCLIIEF